MTTTPALHDEVRRPRTERRVVIVVLVAALVLVGSGTGWAVVTSRALAGVIAPESGFSCSGTRSTYRTVVAQPGMRCTAMIGLYNESGHAVHIHGIDDGIGGPEGGMLVRVGHGHQDDQTGRDTVTKESGRPGRTIRVDETLGPGQGRRFVVVYAFRSTSCFAPGAAQIVALPAVRLSAFGRHRSVSSGDHARVVSGTRGSCG